MSILNRNTQLYYLLWNRALEVWGSQESLNRERMKKAEEVKRYQQCNTQTT